ILPSPKESIAQSISPSSSLAAAMRKPIDSYQWTVSRTSGTWIIGVTLFSMISRFSVSVGSVIVMAARPHFFHRRINFLFQLFICYAAGFDFRAHISKQIPQTWQFGISSQDRQRVLFQPHSVGCSFGRNYLLQVSW